MGAQGPPAQGRPAGLPVFTPTGGTRPPAVPLSRSPQSAAPARAEPGAGRGCPAPARGPAAAPSPVTAGDASDADGSGLSARHIHSGWISPFAAALAGRRVLSRKTGVLEILGGALNRAARFNGMFTIDPNAAWTLPRVTPEFLRVAEEQLLGLAPPGPQRPLPASACSAVTHIPDVPCTPRRVSGPCQGCLPCLLCQGAGPPKEKRPRRPTPAPSLPQCALRGHRAEQPLRTRKLPKDRQEGFLGLHASKRQE
ncbi:uncharacterized protein LOC122451812 [Cervus canadensis]|uniref:uncharacterized protein LOC122451812 n=1 Tax=Cervus canadensis TaxID=1574408 RepID=UPI001C9E985E|nr:uncharacterized protein LOC122451812 [Cervus canadensis]